MTATSVIIGILFILCLTSSVVPRSVGLVRADDKPAQKVWIPLMFGLSQGLMAVVGFFLSKLVGRFFIDDFAPYLVFVMMLVVAVKLFVDSIRILKGKMLYTVSNDWDFILLALMSAFDTLLMSLTGSFFLPFGKWFFPAVAVAGFLWAFFTVRVDFSPGIIKKVSFVEFAAAVFMVIIAILYLFTDLMKC